MCGIAGILRLDNGPVPADVLARMIAMIHHRGPDDHGTHAQGPVGLANARLSIIDLAGGHQPMANEDRTLWITFNGEIFNYRELRDALVRKGHRFSTSSDTEVILQLYADKGEECVHDLNGQWAFAIWDSRRRRLFLSRDRLGVRPLYYTLADHSLIFASEIKSLFAHPAVPRSLDLAGLDQLFTFWCTLPPTTIFDGVFELPPGHSLTVADNQVRVRPYWRLSYPSRDAQPAEPKTTRDYADRLLELLVDATRLRLRSDVPVGAYLSGGLDSSLVTALIQRFSRTPLKTFSVTFDDPEFDERAYQRQVVDHLGTTHHEVQCSYEDISRVFPDVIWHTEKPVLRTAPAPLFLLSRLVHAEGYKVVLTGEGADEIFGGYDIFKEAKIRRFWAASPQSRIRPLLLRRLYPYLPSLRAQSDAYLRAFFHVQPGDQASPFFSHLPRWGMTAMLKRFFSDAVKTELKRYDAYAVLAESLPPDYASWDPFCQAQYLETAYLLPGYILSSQGDRVAMAHSVEGRFPFLDHRVVDFAASVPPHLKMRALTEKYILKRVAADLLPPVIRRRTKQPYRAPEAKSFLGAGPSASPNDYVQDLLAFDRIEQDGIFDPGATSLLLEKIRSGQAVGIKDNMALVGILSTQLLIDQFIHRFSARLPHGLS